MKERIFKKSIAAGIMIGIGAIAKLSYNNQIIGAFLFSIGLFFICCFNMNLFTGKIGYIDKHNFKEYPLIWLGNFTGCVISAGIVRIAKPSLNLIIENQMIDKCNADLLSIAILSTLCGVLMYLAVHNFKTQESDCLKLFGIIIAVVVFLSSGYEHSIANMAYSVLYINDLKSLFQCLKLIFTSTIFNSIGSIGIRMLLEYNQN